MTLTKKITGIVSVLVGIILILFTFFRVIGQYFVGRDVFMNGLFHWDKVCTNGIPGWCSATVPLALYFVVGIVIGSCLMKVGWNILKEKEGNKKLFLISSVIVILTAGMWYFQQARLNGEYDIAKRNVDSQIPKVDLSFDCSERYPDEVDVLLAKNNINLSRLNYIGEFNPPKPAELKYADIDTGFTYQLKSFKKDPVGVEGSQSLTFDVCYNDRLILTRPLQLNFTYTGVFRSAFAYDFSKIELSRDSYVQEKQAKNIAYTEQSAVKGVEPKLGFYDLNAGTGNHASNYTLAWQFSTGGASVVVDAYSGKIIRSFNGVINENF